MPRKRSQNNHLRKTRPQKADTFSEPVHGGVAASKSLQFRVPDDMPKYRTFRLDRVEVHLASHIATCFQLRLNRVQALGPSNGDVLLDVATTGPQVLFGKTVQILRPPASEPWCDSDLVSNATKKPIFFILDHLCTVPASPANIAYVVTSFWTLKREEESGACPTLPEEVCCADQRFVIT